MRTVKLVVGIAFAVGLVSVIFWNALIVGWWLYGDVTPEKRIAVFERHLTGMSGGAVALLPDGAMAIVRRTDVAGIGETTCRRESKCAGRRCSYVYVTFYCAYRIHLRDGANAVAYLLLSGARSDVPALFSPPAFNADKRSIDDAAKELCALGFGCPGDRRPTAAIVAAVPASASADTGCRGVRLPVVGAGDMCLDPDDPGRRMFRDCKDGFCAPAMIALPTGSYRHGSTDEEIDRLLVDEGRIGDTNLFWSEQPAHDVQIGYHLAVGMFEVTNAEWNACVADTVCPPRGSRRGADERKPVSGVSWIDVTRHYLPWLNRNLGLAGRTAYRLPTDAEWEYAARAGTTTRYPGGDLLTTWQARFSASDSAPVGSYPPNRFGLHDMVGNVAQWVQDCFHSSNETPPRDGSAYESPNCGSRIYRNAGWNSLPWYMRSAHRSWSSPDIEWSDKGFRLARMLEE